MDLMVIDQFNVKRIGPFKTENDAPVSPHRHRPPPLQLAFERVQTITGNIQALRRLGGIEHRKNSQHRVQQIGPYSAPVAALIEPLSSRCLNVRIISLHRKVSIVTCQQCAAHCLDRQIANDTLSSRPNRSESEPSRGTCFFCLGTATSANSP